MKIINDVLDLSKLENGKAELRENGVCLPELIEKLSHMLEYSMEQKKIAFQVVCEITNPYVVCDETKLQQILVNVISNAVKFTEAGGIVAIHSQVNKGTEIEMHFCWKLAKGQVQSEKTPGISRE